MPPYDAFSDQIAALDCEAHLVNCAHPTTSRQDRLRCVIAGTSKAISLCSQHVAAGQRYATITGGDTGHVRWVGIARCNCAHSCDDCAPRLANQRASTVSEAFTRARRDGCTIVHITLTHAPLDGSMSAQLDAHDEMTAKLSKRLGDRRRCPGRGIAGTVFGRDVTFSEFDIHHHTHLGIVVQPGKDADDIAAQVIDAYVNIAIASGVRANPDAQNYRVVEPDDDYATAYYIVSGAVRGGHHGDGQTAADVRAAAASGDIAATDCYRRHTSAMSRRKQVTAGGCLRGSLMSEGQQSAIDTPDAIADIDRAGVRLLKKAGVDAALIRRIADAVGGGARRLAAHEALLEYLPSSDPDFAFWRVRWHGFEDTYYNSHAYIYDHGPEVGVFDDETVDGWSRDDYDQRRAAEDEATLADMVAELEAVHRAEARRRRREQRARCAARKAEVAAYARTGNHAAFVEMVRRIENYWSARITTARRDGDDAAVRQHGFAVRAQLRSLERAWVVNVPRGQND